MRRRIRWTLGTVALLFLLATSSVVIYLSNTPVVVVRGG